MRTNSTRTVSFKIIIIMFRTGKIELSGATRKTEIDKAVLFDAVVLPSTPTRRIEVPCNGVFPRENGRPVKLLTRHPLIPELCTPRETIRSAAVSFSGRPPAEHATAGRKYNGIPLSGRPLKIVKYNCTPTNPLNRLPEQAML